MDSNLSLTLSNLHILMATSKNYPKTTIYK